jgi:flagellar hook-basal body complex protein FliE
MPIGPVVDALAVHFPSLGTSDAIGASEPSITGTGGLPVEGGAVAGAGSLPFANVLEDAVASANMRAQDASRVANAFAAGASDDIHGTMIATKEADIELKLVANVRSKLVDAFNDLWHMNI